MVFPVISHLLNVVSTRAMKFNKVTEMDNSKNMQKFRKTSQAMLGKQLKAYSAETSIHGIKYIYATDRHWSER